MSQPRKVILNQHEVNKRIIAKEKLIHADTDMLNLSGRFRDDEYQTYLLKKQQFYDSAKEYKMLNRNTLNGNHTKLDIDGDLSINYDFLTKHEPLHTPYAPSIRLRIRTQRVIHGVLQNCLETPKTMEPWLRRFIILNKFIQIVRKMVLKKRLLDRLKILKGLDLEAIQYFENEGFFIVNQSYPELFAKFIRH